MSGSRRPRVAMTVSVVRRRSRRANPGRAHRPPNSWSVVASMYGSVTGGASMRITSCHIESDVGCASSAMRGKLPCHRDEGSCDDHASECPRAGYPGTQRATPTVTALEGYGVLVTGGGSGIGEGCALALARDGAVVTLCGRTADKLDGAAAAHPRLGARRRGPHDRRRRHRRGPGRGCRRQGGERGGRAARRGALGRRVTAHGPAAPRRCRSGARRPSSST